VVVDLGSRGREGICLEDQNLDPEVEGNRSTGRAVVGGSLEAVGEIDVAVGCLDSEAAIAEVECRSEWELN
jgi:hypothetical protein